MQITDGGLSRRCQRKFGSLAFILLTLLVGAAGFGSLNRALAPWTSGSAGSLFGPARLSTLLTKFSTSRSTIYTRVLPLHLGGDDAADHLHGRTRPAPNASYWRSPPGTPS